VKFKDLTLYAHIALTPEGKIEQMGLARETTIDG
jgi:hypothetical protein